ncbi:MAG: hypothetical protein FD161_438 [Limisphaerales bacterium]|nr:MAG: hypothetical protein FD161_438 [Limisphaerales bacterium]KAG0510343.1 MAG: hypothetical protein E1N63_438 [Limisphaerales bacterium]TXT51530.1 MAG: hypothetical protein FD140_1568 [Limisphaerales bacterium]
MKNQTSYDRITDRITALLTQGTVPWHKPWKAKTGLPRNFVSQKPYRGINVFLLIAMSYESPFWLTFRQAAQLGACVRKGEKACPVVFWKQWQIEDKDSGEQKKIPLLRFHHVFNVTQCDGLNIGTEPVPASVNGISKPEDIVAQMPQPPVVKHGMSRAYYSPHEDCVGLPTRERFDTPEGYYATLFHELVHSTGHEKRLKRAALTESAGFGSNPYCKEELIAEMGAAFLCGHAEISERVIDNSAAYLNGWLEQLQNDKTLIVQAAAQAQKACDFILDVRPEDEGPAPQQPKEFKVVALRECPTPEEMQLCDTPQSAADYWRAHITTHPYFNPECECFVVLHLNTRRRIRGHNLVSTGTMDTILVHAREVFRTAIASGASAIVLMHNHPSGEPAPSEADIKVTRDLIRAGQLLKMEVLDHIVVGNPTHASLRELGYFFQ